MINDGKTRLRGLEYEDLELLHKWMNDFEIIKLLLRIDPSVKCLTEKWYEKVITDNTQRIFAIEDVESSSFIGCIGVRDIDSIDRKAKLYVYIGDANFRGKGLAKSAIIQFIEYMFDYHNLNKIYLYVRSDNLEACNLYKKVGFRQEGVLREDKYIDGNYIDIIYMGLLRRELVK